MRLSLNTRTVTGPRGSCVLSKAQFTVALILACAEDRIVPSDALEMALWPEGQIDIKNSLRVKVLELRRKLLSIGYPIDTIESCENGYRLYDHTAVSEAEAKRVIRLAQNGAKYHEMSAATGRPMGTIKTITSRLRSQGLIARRYALPDWGTLDVY